MKEKALLAPGYPAIQEAAAVQTLIAYLNLRHSLPALESDVDLPEFHRRDAGLCLARDGKKSDVYPMAAPAGCSYPRGRRMPGEPLGATRDSYRPKRSELPIRRWPEMSSKAETVRRIELIDQLSSILRDLRRSEMEELERIEAEETA
ncbi:Uncharacterised protein [uncultured archaeon]|nr:Uncharacterised protein [uncultured archaeon]